MRAVRGDIAKNAEANVLASAVERRGVGRVLNPRRVEDVTAEEEIVHPCPTEDGGHDGAGVSDAIFFGEAEGFLGFAEVFAVGVVEGQGEIPVIRWRAFWPPPTSV